MVQTGGLPAVVALEMNVIVVMMTVGAGFAAEGVLSATFVVQNLVEQSLIQKRSQRPVNRDSVMVRS